MGNPVASALASAHKALDKANRDFPKPSYKMAHEARQSESAAPPAAPKAAPTTGDELKAKADNIGAYNKATE
jgi:hypothetical protein